MALLAWHQAWGSADDRGATCTDCQARLAAQLRAALGERAALLHDRRVPGTRGNIDHLAIVSSAVWVLDANRDPRLAKWPVGWCSSPRLRRLYDSDLAMSEEYDELLWLPVGLTDDAIVIDH